MRITVTLPDQDVARVDAEAKRQDRTRSSMIRILLKEALNQPEHQQDTEQAAVAP